MDLKVAHDFIRYILQKERGGFISPEENDELLDRAQWWFYTDQFDAYAKSQKIEDSLSTFSTKFQFTTPSTGLVQLPVNPAVSPCYEHLLSVYVQYLQGTIIRYKPIKLLSEDEIAERLNSQILAPTVTDPVGMQMLPGQVQLFPTAVLSGYGYYMKKPLKPFFDYTLGEDGRTITYLPSTSVQMEWNDSSMNKILVKAIQLAGVNIGNQSVVQFAELKNQQDI